MPTIIDGPYCWEGSRDETGHRTFKVTHLVESELRDGPYTIMCTPGLPLVGSPWFFGNDADISAWCRADMTVKYHGVKEGHPGRFWKVDQTFSTKPGQRCQDQTIEDPLREPPKLSGSFVKYTLEATHDRYGRALKTSSHEPLRGPQVEFDDGRATVKIEQNIRGLGLATITRMYNTVNGYGMWGLAKRCVKLSEFTWERNVRGTCGFYFTRVLGFDIYFNTFDRWVVDEGNMALHGENKGNSWFVTNLPDGSTPNPANPFHFVHYKDANGDNAKCLLDGQGRPLNRVLLQSGQVGPVTQKIEKYNESNLLLLGIPSQLG
jgi:hypothetical protein